MSPVSHEYLHLQGMGCAGASLKRIRHHDSKESEERREPSFLGEVYMVTGTFIIVFRINK